MQQNKDVLNTWTEAAPYWEKHRKTIHGMFAPITDALIEAAQIETGHSVLDVATGPGEPALSITDVVGPGGSVVGIDPIPEMIAACEREASHRGLTNARFHVASADLIPAANGSFDAVVCRFGVMFFPSPLDSVREMLRVLKTGRKLAFAVWHFAERNPFHYMLAQVVDRYVQPVPLAPDAPDAFRFAASGKLLNILNQAGATATSERLLQFNIDMAIAAEDFWTLRLEMSEKLRKKLAPLSPETLAVMRHQVMDDLPNYSIPQGIRFPAEILIVSGTKADR